MKAQLKDYLEKKQADLEISKLQLKEAHVNKLNQIYQVETENWSKIVMAASEIIQDNFLLLRSLGEIDKDTLEKLQLLAKMLQGQRNVKFADDGPMVVVTEIIDSPELNIMNLSDCSSDDTAQTPVSAKKRFIDDELENGSKKLKSSSEDFQFVRPKAMKSIDFNTASSSRTVNANDLNITFDLNGAVPILSERSSKPSSSSSSLKCKRIYV